MKVFVFFGGESVEHDISIITAMQVLRVRPDFVPVYIARDGIMWMGERLKNVNVYTNFERRAKGVKKVSFLSGRPFLFCERGLRKTVKVDFALLCMHGHFGEDGGLQSVLESCHIPYSSSNSVSCALCMDKIFMKNVLDSSGVPNVKGYALNYDEYLLNPKRILKDIEKSVKFPLILKPARLGSSIGIRVVKTKEEFCESVEFCAKFDNRILVEKYLDDIVEYNCAGVCVNGEVVTSNVYKVENNSAIFSFEEKYLKGVKEESAFSNLKPNADEFTLDVGEREGERLDVGDKEKFEGKCDKKEVVDKYDKKEVGGCFVEKGLKNIENNYKKDEKSVKNALKSEKSLEKQIKMLTTKVYKIFDCFGVVRADFIFDRSQNKLYVNELNTIPGSLAFHLFKNLTFKALISALVEEGLERQKRENFVRAYDSPALDVFEKIDFAKK